MRTNLKTTLAALGLASLLSFGSAQAQEFLAAAAASRPAPAIPGSAPSAGATQSAQFPRSAFPVTAPSASDHNAGADYAQVTSFPHSAAPAGTSLSAPSGTPDMQRIARALPRPVPQAPASVGSGRNG